MPFFVWTEIVCDLCSDTVAGHWTSGAIPRPLMKREAGKAGWRLVTVNEWRCPSCIARRKAKEEEEARLTD